MKKILRLVLFTAAYLLAISSANATEVSARFTFDDGSAVAGQVTLYKVAQPTDTLVGTYVLDSQGRVSSDIALDPTATYHAQLIAPGGNVLQQVWTASLSSTVASLALQMLPTGEIDVVLAKADGSIKSVQFVQMDIPQTQFASCVSTPSARTYRTSDSGGGLAVGYIVNGQTFDCQVSVPAAGSYPLSVRAESPYNSAKLHFEYPVGTPVGNEVSVSATIKSWGSSEIFETFPAGMVALPAGTVTIRIVVDQKGLNLNWFN
jgi:Carbohydrate binding module (family 35)